MICFTRWSHTQLRARSPQLGALSFRDQQRDFALTSPDSSLFQHSTVRPGEFFVNLCHFAGNYYVAVFLLKLRRHRPCLSRRGAAS